jgi:hypothetical protein
LISRLKSLNSKLSAILSGGKETYTNPFSFTTALFHSVPTSCARDNPIRLSEINRNRVAPIIDSPQSVNRHRPLRFEMPQQRNIRSARKLYDDLCDISVLINSMYGIQFLLELGAITAELTVSSYLILAKIQGTLALEADTTGRFICVMAAWLLL